MYLINSVTYELQEFVSKPPRYAILSHTWGDEEVSFNAMRSGQFKHLKGFQKIEQSCALAKARFLAFVWVDTCCIDKKSSAELSEAINSMYRYYKEAEVCFTFLSDVKPGVKISSSRWFKRGWTLQELLSSHELEFYDCHWIRMGSRIDFRSEISTATGIQDRHIFFPREASVAQKFSWLGSRETTREEDMAYCMLGLFDVNMPLLYGEGKKAFRRLQEEILRVCADESLFAWSTIYSTNVILAPSPDAFSRCGKITPKHVLGRKMNGMSITSMTNLGLSVHATYLKLSDLHSQPSTHSLWDSLKLPREEPGLLYIAAVLDCVDENADNVVIWLSRKDSSPFFTRCSGLGGRISHWDIQRLQIELHYERIIVSDVASNGRPGDSSFHPIYRRDVNYPAKLTFRKTDLLEQFGYRLEVGNNMWWAGYPEKPMRSLARLTGIWLEYNRRGSPEEALKICFDSTICISFRFNPYDKTLRICHRNIVSHRDDGSYVLQASERMSKVQNPANESRVSNSVSLCLETGLHVWFNISFRSDEPQDETDDEERPHHYWEIEVVALPYSQDAYR